MPKDISTKAAKKEVEDFFKMAFCISGKARMIPGAFESNYAVQMTDKKRGTFFVAVVKPKKARFINH